MSNSADSCITKGDLCHSQTNYPQFIDTQSCLCGFLNSSAASRNGNLEQWWRCIGDANEDVGSGDHGKWFQASLPSEELSGLARPQYWDQNPPKTTPVYVLEDKNGKKNYTELKGNDSPEFKGKDSSCTGKNDTELSTKYYKSSNEEKKGNDTKSSESSSKSSSSTESSSSTKATAASGKTSSTSTATSSSTSPSKTSSASTKSLTKSWLLLGMVVGPFLATIV